MTSWRQTVCCTASPQCCGPRQFKVKGSTTRSISHSLCCAGHCSRCEDKVFQVWFKSAERIPRFWTETAKSWNTLVHSQLNHGETLFTLVDIWQNKEVFLSILRKKKKSFYSCPKVHKFSHRRTQQLEKNDNGEKYWVVIPDCPVTRDVTTTDGARSINAARGHVENPSYLESWMIRR